MRDFIVGNRASIWLCFAVMVVAATMMTPHFASMIAIAIVAVLVFAVRAVAHIEGQAVADAVARKDAAPDHKKEVPHA